MNESVDILPSWYKMDGESDASYSNFELYRTMPPSERSVAECERRLGLKVGHSYIRNICKKFNWVERARDWDNHMTSVKDKALLDQVSEIKIEYVEEARAVRIAILKSVEEFYKRYRENPHLFKTMSDKELIKFVANIPDKLKRIQEVEFTAYGHATEISKQDVDVNTEGKTYTITISDK